MWNCHTFPSTFEFFKGRIIESEYILFNFSEQEDRIGKWISGPFWLSACFLRPQVAIVWGMKIPHTTCQGLFPSVFYISIACISRYLFNIYLNYGGPLKKPLIHYPQHRDSRADSIHRLWEQIISPKRETTRETSTSLSCRESHS